MNKEEISKRIDEGLQILKQESSFIFNLKEIEAIQYLQNEIIDIQKDINFHLDKENIISKEELKAKQTILNLISKLQKELESQKQGNKDLVKEGVKLSAKIVELQKELDKKDICLKACEDNLIKERQLRIKQDKVIDKMAKTIAGLQLYDFGRKEYFTLEDEGEVKEYFYKKVEEENVKD